MNNSGTFSRAQPTQHEKDIYLTKVWKRTMNKDQMTLAPCITRDVELGGIVVAQYGITCHYDWQETKTFSLQIGNMQEEYMKGIEADYFWGFADMLSPRTLTGALYAVFSKGENVLIHEFTNTTVGYSHHRVFTMDAVRNLERTYVGTNNSTWVKLDKPQPDSFTDASISLQPAITCIADSQTWVVVKFPEYAHAGRFDRLPYTVDQDRGVLEYVLSGGMGVLMVTAGGKESQRYLGVGAGIEFEGIYRNQTGVEGRVTAVFKFGNGASIHVSPPNTWTEERRPEISVYCPDLAKSMYLTKRLFSDEIWLDENGLLCSQMREPKPSKQAYWRYEENNGGWRVCETGETLY